MSAGSSGRRTVAIRAHAIAARLNVREIAGLATLGGGPLTVEGKDGGRIVVFRFGAVVMLGIEPAEEGRLLELLRAEATDLWDQPGLEEATLVIDPQATEGIDAQGFIVVDTVDTGSLQVIANVLAKSAALTHHEERLGAIFDRVESLAERLQRARRTARTRELLRRIGDVLVTQARMVGRVEVSEKPEITWDRPDLDRMYERLALEFELRERDRALSRKLELISDIARTFLDLIHSRQSLRLEWYIVVLIVIEIGLTLYEMFWPH